MLDAFIRIDNIDGESTDDQHTGWIEVINYGLGVRQSVSSTASSAGGATVERTDFKSFHFTRPLDKASPKLALACAAGTHIDEILVELCRAGGEKIKYMTYTMRDCIINRVSTIGGGGFPMESVYVHYGQIQWAYTQQNRSGGGALGQVAAGWNLKKNCRL